MCPKLIKAFLICIVLNLGVTYVLCYTHNQQNQNQGEPWEYPKYKFYEKGLFEDGTSEEDFKSHVRVRYSSFPGGQKVKDYSQWSGPPSAKPHKFTQPQFQSQPDPLKLTKPSPSEWIFGRESKDKLNLISWLVDGCFFYPNPKGTSVTSNSLEKCPLDTDEHSSPPEFQTFDGFFNNPFKVDLGSVDTPLLRRVPPVYKDGVYEPIPKDSRANPFHASKLMERLPSCPSSSGDSNPIACGSKTGKTAFLVFFGQQVVEEILDAQRPGCPPEYFNVDIPPDPDSNSNKTGHTQMPFLRSRWSQSTGHSPGNPRQQLNEITPWIDGGLIYGTSKGWSDVLRTRPNGTLVPKGLLASVDDKGYFPALNHLRLPLANPPPPAFHSQFIKHHETSKVSRFFVLGNPRGNENAFLLSFGIVLFRWHNLFATYLSESRPSWSGERVFQEARKWVIATYQHIVIDDWLPEWLGEGLEKYEGYDPAIDPQIEQFFQTAAMRFGHTLVTPGAYMRDYACGKCKPVAFAGLGGHKGMHTYGDIKKVGMGAVRTCNIFWRPQEPLLMKVKDKCIPEDDRDFADIDRLLMGMASQKSEREDNMIVEDLRGRVFGPLEFSRRDLMAVNIQRGRDHGTPDYNSAREAFGLKRLTSVQQFLEETKSATPRKVVEKLEKIHNLNKMENGSYLWDNIDVWTGGILETTFRPGPLFRVIIKDQFKRIRDADRFWFENRKWKKVRFSSKQIGRIKKLKVFDMVVAVTKMLPVDIQQNPFRVPTEDFKGQSPDCFKENPHWETGTCATFDSRTELEINSSICYHFPQLDSIKVPVEPCTPLESYDYFDGSELWYILTFTALGFIILVIASMVPVVASFRQKEREKTVKIQKGLRHSFKATSDAVPLSAREYLGSKEGTRSVVLLLSSKSLLEIRSHKGELLRSVDLSKSSELDLILVNDGKHIVLKNPKEYDCVFSFEGKVFRSAFVSQIKQRFSNKIAINESTGSLHQSLAQAVTKDKRLRKLENFFKIVFAQAFSIDQPKGEADLIDPKLIREVIKTELTQAEFASALSMKSGSQFVSKMFALIDRDANGYISFREFLDMLIIFAKGTAEDKARLMFEMYDIDRSGYLSNEEFKCMIRSMVEAANADVNEEEVDKMTKLMLEGVGLKIEDSVSLKDFHRLMSEYKETLGYAQLDFSGVNVPKSQAKGSRKSYHEAARSTVLSIYGEVPAETKGESSGSKGEPLNISKDNVTLASNTRDSKGPLSRWIELYRLQVFWGTMYTLIILAIFMERAYVYSFEKEHSGLRQIAGYGVTLTRGAASAMMFAYATLLLTMCRNLITRLRETVLHRFIPFDSFIPLHKYIAILGLFFAILHIIGHAINFYHISTQTASDLSCLFRDYHRPTHVIPKFQYWAFETVTGLSGLMLVLLAALIYTFATNYARAYAFRMFWITHNTYPLWYILILIHGSGRLVQEPLFFRFLIVPLIIFVIDKLVSASRKQVEIPVLKAEILPSQVTKLEFARPTGFDYQSGQWIRIATRALNANEFHPFTLSSAPHEPHLSVHIRAVGPFTSNIRRTYETLERPFPKLYVDGPYGEGHQDWWRYEVSILVGGGIGVTPFASILKDVANNNNPRNCKKIYFLWVTRTQKQFEWLVDIIREVEECKLISVHLFITQIYNKFDLRTVLLYIFERHFQRINNRSLFTGLKSVTHFGRPNFKLFFKTLRSLHPNVSKFGVFSCGPFPMTKTVDEACLEVSHLSDETGSIFQHHFENF